MTSPRAARRSERPRSRAVLLPAAAALVAASGLACGAASTPAPVGIGQDATPPAPPAASQSSGDGTIAGHPSGDGASASDPTRAGFLSVSMIASSDPRVESVRVRVEKVTAHVPAMGWIVLQGTPVDVDLLRLAAPESSVALGWAELPAGIVTQVRLLIASSTAARGSVDPVNHVVDRSGGSAPLEVPSGEQSGVKIVGPFTVSPCSRTALTLELDTGRSLWVHRTGGVERWILRPVIRVRTSPPSSLACPDAGGATGGTPGGAQAGATCDRDEDCLSNLCVDGCCAPGGSGAACATSADCTTAACVAGTCGAGTTGWTGAACSAPAECASNACADGRCQPGEQGAACLTSGDCIATLRCVVAAPSGATCSPPSY